MTAAATTPASGPSSPTGLRVGEPPEPPRGDPHRPHVPLDRPADDLLEAASRQRMNIARVPRSARTSPTTLQIAEPPETPCDYPQPHRSPAALRIAEPPEPPARTADHPADDLPEAATCPSTNAAPSPIYTARTSPHRRHRSARHRPIPHTRRSITPSPPPIRIRQRPCGSANHRNRPGATPIDRTSHGPPLTISLKRPHAWARTPPFSPICAGPDIA
jgi:hypothetical protein